MVQGDHTVQGDHAGSPLQFSAKRARQNGLVNLVRAFLGDGDGVLNAICPREQRLNFGDDAALVCEWSKG
ncbi:MAG: hypothetical protein HY281_10710, partial [Nitrospirae bacterium]|nr:hypothetical protein [Nitrospirota bacterium]